MNLAIVGLLDPFGGHRRAVVTGRLVVRGGTVIGRMTDARG
jgi:hypothetical protein